MLMKMRTLGVLLASSLAVMAAGAETITYSFVAGAHSGYFSYDDTNTTQVAPPPDVSTDGAYYAATAFSLDGVSYSGTVISIFNNTINTFDAFVVTTDLGLYPNVSFMTLAHLDTLSDSSLSSLNNIELSDFEYRAGLHTDHSNDGPGILVTSLERVIPEPTSMALSAGALAALVLARRRKSAAQASSMQD